MSDKAPEPLNNPALQAAHVGIPRYRPTRLTSGCANGTGYSMNLLPWEDLP